MTASAHPGRLVASGVPQRADSSLEADWAMAMILVAWVHGHDRCGGLRPGPVPECPECPCGGLRFQIGRPLPMTEAALPLDRDEVRQFIKVMRAWDLPAYEPARGQGRRR